MCHSPCGDIGCLSQLASSFSVYLHECFSVHAQILMKDGVCIGADFPQQQSGMCAENPTVSNLCYCCRKICHSCRKERKWWNQRRSTTEVPSHLFLIFSHKSLCYTDNTLSECKKYYIYFHLKEKYPIHKFTGRYPEILRCRWLRITSSRSNRLNLAGTTDWCSSLRHLYVYYTETTSGSKVYKVRLLVTDMLINMVQMQSRCMLLLHDKDGY